MSKREIGAYLDNILEAVHAIYRYTNDMEYETFKVDDKTYKAVIRDFLVIGEALKHVEDLTQPTNPEIEESWQDLIDMRNKLIHEYFGIDLEIVWYTIQEALPKFENDVLTVKQYVEEREKREKEDT